MDIKRINPTPRWSDATVFNGLAHFVEIAADSSEDITNQATQILTQAEKTLASIGSNKARILSVTIYITDLSHLTVFNEIWEKWLPFACAPSRACLKVELADPALLIEIAFVAAVAQ